MSKQVLYRCVINGQGLTEVSHQCYACNMIDTSLLYALRVLRCHGMPEQSSKDVFQATVFAKITYCLYQRGLVSVQQQIEQELTPS